MHAILWSYRILLLPRNHLEDDPFVLRMPLELSYICPMKQAISSLDDFNGTKTFHF